PRGCGKPIDPTTAASPSCTSATKAYVWAALACIPRTGSDQREARPRAPRATSDVKFAKVGNVNLAKGGPLSSELHVWEAARSGLLREADMVPGALGTSP